MTERLKASRYNVAVPSAQDGVVFLFNTATRAMLSVDPESYSALEPLFLEGRRGLPLDWHVPVDPATYDADTLQVLRDGGFVIPEPLNELAVLRQHFEEERNDRRLYYTIGLTMTCNFGCPYCFEKHLPMHMDEQVANATHDFIVARIRASDAKSIFVNWFGGEPLLVTDVLVHFSAKLRESCKALGVEYKSVVITNGALLTAECARRLAAAGVDTAQVTLDGPPAIHDKRRFFKGGRASFEQILTNLRAVRDIMSLIIRINVDQQNKPHLGELVRILEEAKLFEGPNSATIYASPVVPYTDQAKMVAKVVEQKDLPSLKEGMLAELKAAGLQQDAHTPQRSLLEVERGGCSAMRNNSFVIGPRGHLFKCDLSIHDNEESIGTVQTAPQTAPGEPVPEQPATKKALPWQRYNPFDNEACAGCQFVPICKGGCPKKVMEGNELFMAGTCSYWDKNFPRLLKDAATAPGK